MTTGESIDNVDMENVTITSDAAYERVTSDEHFEEERDGGYLKQNTAGLVQEIPNISFLDIGDTMLESKKTLFDKKNYNVVVGVEGKSIETIPQDSVNLRLGADQSVSQGTDYVRFDTWDITDKSITMNYESNYNRIKILESGYYRISYGWTIDIGNATALLVVVMQNSTDIVGDNFTGVTGTTLSGGKTISTHLTKGDYISLLVGADDTITVKQKYTYLELQYVGKSI